MQRRETQRGFTLIELMVVIAIIALFSALLFGTGSRSQGGNAENIAEQTQSALNFARTRAVNTRKTHRVIVTANEVQIWANTATGFSAFNSSTSAFVQRFTIPTGVIVWGAETNIRSAATNSATPVAQNANLPFNVDFRPDGTTTTGGTIYVGDSQNATNKKYRVVIYRATGSSYARKTW